MQITKTKNHPSLYLLILLCLTLLAYGDILFLPGHLVYSRPGGDFSLGYYGINFTLSQIKQGIFPLWCPQIMGGYPYFANLQTLIFYPFSLLWLIFSVNQATNLFFICHVFLIGAGTFLWLYNKKMSNLAALLSAVIIMFSSFVGMRISMGHITPLAVITWFPWILICIDNLRCRNNLLRDFLLTIFFLSLQITAGFPQQVIYSCFAVIFYSALLLLFTEKQRARYNLLFLSIIFAAYLISALLNAVQLSTTLDVIKETARQTSLPSHYISTFPLSPYALINFFAPFFYGNAKSGPYWGPWLDFYSINFIGITTLILAFYAVIASKNNLKWIAIIITVPCFIYVLGKITPFFHLITQLPLLSKMRAPFRAIFYINFFIAALAGLGLHELIKSPSVKGVRWTLFVTTAILCVIAFGYVLIDRYSTPQNIHLWQGWTAHVAQPFWTTYLQHHAKYAFATSSDAKSSLLFAMVILLCAIILLILIKYYKRTPFLLFTLILFELLSFSMIIRTGFPIAITYNQTLKKFVANHPTDARFLKIPNNNWGMSLSPQVSGGDINGYESMRLRRYEDFVNFNEGHKLGSVQEFLQITEYKPMFRFLRCKYVFIVKGDKKGNVHYKILEKPGALPHLLLVNQWKVLPDAKQILTTMKSPSFPARGKVILESNPTFYPAKPNAKVEEQIQLVRSTTQWLDIKATTTRNSILLVTDAYAKGWKVFPYPDSAQQKYDVMPADYILRGIPLSPGTHHFRLQYAPDAFYRGRNISLAALALYLFAWLTFLGLTIRKKRENKSPEDTF
jgi:hypothetical protein